jgi:hypothetical protein
VPTSKALRREADALERRAAELTRRATVLREAARALDEGADVVPSQVGATLDGIVTGIAKPPRRSPRPAITPGEAQRRLGIAAARSGEHPFPQAVLATGRTVSEWSAAHGLKHYVVRTWYGKGRTGRPIPRQWADAIEEEFSIPASAWPRGVKG